MAWTYTGATSAPSSAGVVRLLTGQVSSQDDELLYDSEVTWTLSQFSNEYEAAALGCDILSAKYAANPDQEKVGQLGLTWGSRAEKYAKKATELRALRQRVTGAGIYVGGISLSDKQIDQADTDRVPMSFQIGMDDNPRADQDVSRFSSTNP